jgi:ATP-dependent DNA helicase RecQ
VDGSTEESPSGFTAIGAAARQIGITELRPEQERAINDALLRKDVLVVLPTGFGKSACYQVPSLLLDKPVLMISPLLALLRDQHDKLIQRGVPGVRLDGTVRGRERTKILETIRAGGSLLVMTTPESLHNEEVFGALQKSGVDLAAIDEAHCISEWGFDFRPAYLRLGERLRALGGPPIMALTATAIENVRKDIVRFLGMRDPSVVALSPHRSNLAFEVIASDEATRIRGLARLVKRLHRPGIVYCATTKRVDELWLVFNKIGVHSYRYHGKMSGSDRTKNQEDFMKHGRRSVMVATSAFGLGIDKQDIRYVLHAQTPASLEQYAQEAGRAGRDGRKANCVLFYSHEDREVHEALLSRSRLRPEQLYKLGYALAAWAREGRKPNLEVLALSADLGPRATAALLTVIEEAGIVRFEGTNEIEVLAPPETVEERSRALAGQFTTLRTQDARRLDSIADYARVTECRAVHLRRYFGEPEGELCNLCDVCRGRPERPETFWQPIAPKKKKRRRRRRRRRRGKGGGQGQPPQGGGGPPPNNGGQDAPPR